MEDGELAEKIGNKLKMLRKESGYTSYEKFAIENDLDRKYYWSIEKGRNISVFHLNKLLRIHGLSFAQFFADEK